MPVIFSGHGSPMIALEHNELTTEMKRFGDAVQQNFGRSKAILSISAHWYIHTTAVQSEPHPKQIYDMYGFPKALYDVKYPVNGCINLTKEVQKLPSSEVVISNDWGIDHGTWTVLVHMFPNHDIPVVQLSINGDLSPKQHCSLSQKLIPLREKGYLRNCRKIY